MSNITVKDEYHDPNLTPGDPGDYQWYNDLAFYYDKGKNVRMVLRGRWKSDGDGGFEDYERHWSREFMYDNPRARFMARELNPADFHPCTADDPNTPGVDEAAWLWTDYAGVTPTLDLELRSLGSDPDELSVVEKRSYGPGGWQDLAYDPNDPNAPPTVSTTRYAHGDLIDSTVLTTDESANAVATVAYTAFGEMVGGAGYNPSNLNTRYRYAGGHGYEADVLHGAHAPLTGPNPTLAPIALVHVGARWYDPSIGRFVQRDPIGVFGGANLYVYVGNQPLEFVDPTGQDRWYSGEFWPHIGATVGNDDIGYWQIDFAPNSGSEGMAHYCLRAFAGAIWGCEGVCSIVEVGRPVGRPERKTTSAEDSAALQYALRKSYYHVLLNNCVHVANDVLDHGKPKPEPWGPHRPRGGCGLR